MKKVYLFSLLCLTIAPLMKTGWSQTTLLEANPGTGHCNAQQMTPDNNGNLFFVGNDGSCAYTLFYTDGTVAGTVGLACFPYSFSGPNPSNLVNLNGTLIFVGHDGSTGPALWKSDGTVAGTQMIVDISPSTFDGPKDLFLFNNKVYFSADDGINGNEIWETDGTLAGTQLMADLVPGSGGVNMSDPHPSDNVFFFSGYTSAHGIEIWKSDGTLAGTSVMDYSPGSANTQTQSLHAHNDSLFFSMGSSNESYVTDGTIANTYQLFDTGGNPLYMADNYVNHNGLVYFRVSSELYRSNGSQSGTYAIQPTSGFLFVNNNTMVSSGNYLYFFGNDGSTGYEIWRTDGTPAGTFMIDDLNAGSQGQQNGQLGKFNGKAYATAGPMSYDTELYTTDGSLGSLTQVEDINPAGSDYVDSFRDSGTKLYFRATTPANGSEVYVLEIPCSPTTGTDIQTACDTYTWIDGNTYTASNNTATHVLTNAAGCDSTVMLDLTILNATTGVDVQNACDSYTWIDGNTYTSSNNTATFTLTNSAGCDSLVTLDLSLSNSTTAADLQTACGSYTWIDGNTYTSSNNTATFTLTTAAGCDSLVTLDLTIVTIDTSVTASGANLSANQTGASYQWLDCSNSLTPVSGETNQTFAVSTGGDYAVRIDMNGCTDTSSCHTVAFTGLPSENYFGLSLYPNPTSGQLNVNIENYEKGMAYTVYNALGQIVHPQQTVSDSNFIIHLDGEKGLYVIELETPQQAIYRTRVIKQ